MTREKAIVLLECSATELTGTLAKTTNPSAAEQLQRYIDAYDMAISALRQQETMTKCHDLYDEDGGEIYQEKDSICSSTNLPCCRCNPGPCEHRKETATNRNGLKVVEIGQVKPLTLDELRKMDGEPAWFVSMRDGFASWGIVRVVEMSKAWFIAVPGQRGPLVTLMGTERPGWPTARSRRIGRYDKLQVHNQER